MPTDARVFALVASLSLPALAEPCSICRCGDPTFNALGKDGLTVQGWRLAMDWERFDKTEGDPAGELESQVENRWTLHASYGFNDRLSLLARVPLSERRLAASAAGAPLGGEHTTGFSDPEIYAQVRLWSSRFGTAVGRRTTLSLVGGVKTPWGQNGLEHDGVRVDEHAQPGTGSTDLFGSVALLHLLTRKSAVFASAGYRHTGRNASGYRYGSSLLGNLAYERKLTERVDGIVELNYRHAARDDAREDANPLHNTGGSLLYVTPRLALDVGRGVVLRAAVQIPLVRSLYGAQRERVVVNGGVTYLVGRR
jgi:hypothetical protein